MRQKLTDVTIRNLKYSEEGSKKYLDTVTPGFGIRISARSKSFFVMYGKSRTLKTLGKYPQISLSKARKEAMRYLVLKPEKERTESLTAAREAYLEECEAKNRPSTIKSYKNLLSKVDEKPLADIKKTDIDLSNAHQVMAWKVFFNWCLRNELVIRNPFLGIPVTYGKRDRVLTAEEIKKIWHYEDNIFSDIVKVLLLTGARREEVLYFQKTPDGYYLPADKAKNHTAHTLPATDLLDALMPLSYFNGWGKSKARMDKKTGVTNWKLHDIRRTYATIHAQLGTPIHIIESLLNHVSGSVSGIARVYNRYDYLKEATEAVAKYEAHIQTVIA